MLLDPVLPGDGAPLTPQHAEKAGPRARIYFDPTTVTAGIVTCGGLSPGLNNVVRSLVLELTRRYGVPKVLGFRFGYEGLDPERGAEPLALDAQSVHGIHYRGGSVLGLGRGGPTPERMLDRLQQLGVNMLFTVGGDGTLRGAHAIAEEAARRGLALSVVGVPKTIDNDVPFCERTFGFETAVTVARSALDAAHTEAVSARNGVGLVKLMGRDAGFIAARATLASSDVDVCLIPEAPFDLYGSRGLLAHLERRLEEQGHALVVVAEGCGAHLARADSERDRGGNLRYASRELDVGPWLRDAIAEHFAHRKLPLTLKYIDPSYLLRSVPANASDSVFCDQLARNAVHAAMAGRTDVLLGNAGSHFVHVPLGAVVGAHKRVDTEDEQWLSVLELTGQPRMLNAIPSLLPPAP